VVSESDSNRKFLHQQIKQDFRQPRSLGARIAYNQRNDMSEEPKTNHCNYRLIRSDGTIEGCEEPTIVTFSHEGKYLGGLCEKHNIPAGPIVRGLWRPEFTHKEESLCLKAE
jgi:hypothetical protein